MKVPRMQSTTARRYVALSAGIGKDILFRPLQHACQGDVVDVGHRTHHGMGQPRVGYQGGREENLGAEVAWHVAMKRSLRKALPQTALGEKLDWLEQLKASIRAKVEHPFHVVKNLFKHSRTRYCGLAKNTAQLHTLFGLANLVFAR
jgi:hypothetical protein